MATDLVPYSDIEKMGKAIAGSGLFGLKTESQAVALMLIAQALGKHPALAAMEYNIIQGRPAKKADAMLIDFQGAGGKVEWHTLTDEKAEATFSHPSGGSLKLDWTIDRAKKAMLYDKEGSMYKKYPRQMLRARLVADGVRAVYPAATGGMLSKEEAEDIIDVTADSGKSRVEQMVEAQVEVKPEVIDAPKKEKAKKADPVAVEATIVAPAPVPAEGNKVIQGVITVPAKHATVDRDGKPTSKWSFTMGDAKYGTFDQALFESVSAILDKQGETPILLNIEYKERPSGDKILRDIVRVSEAVAGKNVPI